MTSSQISGDDADRYARVFHDTYERLAPQFGYKTREASAVPWGDVPADNKALMVATVRGVLTVLAEDRWLTPPGVSGEVAGPHRCSRC